MTARHPATLVGLLLCAACGSAVTGALDAGPDAGPDAGFDAGPLDAGVVDAGPGDAGTSDAGDAGVDSGFAVAAHLPLPTIPNNGGKVLEFPELVTISFADFPFNAAAIGDALVTPSWVAGAAGYGVRLVTHLADYVIPDAGPVSGADSDVQALIEGLILQGSVPRPTPDTVYLLFLGLDADITVGTAQTCQNLLGYHYAYPGDAGFVVYGVAVPCSHGDGWGDPTGEEISMAASHELAEAATDPYPYPLDPGFADLQMDPFVLSGLSDEVADWCDSEAPVLLGGAWMSRVWSNEVAAQGAGDPCLPLPPGDVYYNVSIDPGGVTSLSSTSSSQVVTFNLTGWSTGPMSDWTLDLFTSGMSTIKPLSGGFNGNLPRVQINNGKTVTLQIALPAGISSGSFLGVGVISSPSGFPTQGGIHYNYNATAIYVP
jgi:hypothetical protein